MTDSFRRVCRVVLLLSAPVMAGGAGFAQASSLPSGPGLAAGYPGDAGIENHPSVVFVENFETGTIQQIRDRWGFGRHLDRMALTSDVPQGSASPRSLQMTATRQQSGVELYKTFTGPDDGWETIFLRFNVKFAHDYGLNHHFVGLKGAIDPPTWPVGGAGSRPENSFSVGIEPTRISKNLYPPNAVFPPPGNWHFYTYWPEMRSWQTPEGEPDGRPSPYFGNQFWPLDPGYAVVRDQWVTIEIMMKLNSTPESYDGALALWVDGDLAVHFGEGTLEGYFSHDHFRYNPDDPRAEPFPGFRWREDMDLMINILRLQNYVSSGTFDSIQNLANQGWDVNTTEATVAFANIVMATEYIGPMNPIPEPASLALLGLAGLLLGRRRRR